MKGELNISNNKVYKDGVELKGFKKILALMFGYFVAAVVLVAAIGIILLIGGVITIGVPIVIGFVLLCIFVSMIIGIIKMLFR